MGRLALLLGTAVVALGCRDSVPPPTGRTPAAPALADPQNDDAGTGAMPGEPPATPDAVRDVDGVVVRARGGTVVIQPADGDTVVLALGPDVPVTVEGRAASAADVREGQRVRAAYTFEDGDAQAIRIDVDRAAP
jgi:hypothetical protein